MKKAKLVALMLCYSIAIAVLFYFVGYKTASGDSARAPGIASQTFYATIEDTWGDSGFTVRGMEINDINYRGRFDFVAHEDTMVVWRGTNISIEDLDIGDNVSITFSGAVFETNPMIIEQVGLVQLLDDEK